jgi:hypothetical protein
MNRRLVLVQVLDELGRSRPCEKRVAAPVPLVLDDDLQPAIQEGQPRSRLRASKENVVSEWSRPLKLTIVPCFGVFSPAVASAGAALRALRPHPPVAADLHSSHRLAR